MQRITLISFKILLALGCLQSYLFLVHGQATGTQCPPVPGEPGCVCDHPDGKLDLKGFANNNGNPKYANLVDSNKYTYEFNPCYTFSITGGCDNVFICQKDANIENTYYPIGAAGTEKIYIDTENGQKVTYLYYTEDTSGRYARMYLTCDKSITGDPKFVVTGDASPQPILHYKFEMKHSGLCPGDAPINPGGGGGGGDDVAGPIGLVLIFLSLGALLAYFIIGAVIMKLKFQANGLEVVPNKAFWFALPFLIKDGFLFTFSPCVSAVKNRGYNKA